MSDIPLLHPLREYRLRQRATQAGFAQLVGWSEGSLREVELGHVRAGDALVARLAAALALPWADAVALCRRETR